MLPLLARVSESRGGFDWDDETFEREYGELERALYGSERLHVAVAPLVGLEVPAAVDLGGGVQARPFVVGELAGPWPESSGLLPDRFGREPDRAAVLELKHALPAGSSVRPDAAAELADAATALRLALGGAIATGSVFFERIDRHPVGVKPMLPIAAALPAGEPTRLDVFRGDLARRLRERVAAADEDRRLGDALDRWELALFQDEPFHSEQLRGALESVLGDGGGLWAASFRAALLLGGTGSERNEQYAQLRRFVDGDARAADAGVVRNVLLETLLHGDRAGLVAWLDEALLGVRPPPTSYFARLVEPAGEPVAA